MDASLSWAQTAASHQPCPVDVREAVIAALQAGVGDVPLDYKQERMERNSPVIPDYNVLQRPGPVYVREYVDELECNLDETVLPRPANRTFALVDDDRLANLARRDKNGIS